MKLSISGPPQRERIAHGCGSAPPSLWAAVPFPPLWCRGEVNLRRRHQRDARRRRTPPGDSDETIGYRRHGLAGRLHVRQHVLKQGGAVG